MVKKTVTFSFDTGTLRTDRQTDGRTDRQTYLLYRYRASVCWRAITKWQRLSGSISPAGNRCHLVEHAPKVNPTICGGDTAKKRSAFSRKVKNLTERSIQEGRGTFWSLPEVNLAWRTEPWIHGQTHIICCDQQQYPTAACNRERAITPTKVVLLIVIGAKKRHLHLQWCRPTKTCSFLMDNALISRPTQPFMLLGSINE